MVCIYCTGNTNVTNSRLQKRTNTVWRRRRCTLCKAVFTTSEGVAYEGALGITNTASHIVPFERDLLFLSIYEACRHREYAVKDATALTNTIIAKLYRLQDEPGLIDRDNVIMLTSETLKAFDPIACVHYLAFHPLAKVHSSPPKTLPISFQ